jgi:hypothetical protein
VHETLGRENRALGKPKLFRRKNSEDFGRTKKCFKRAVKGAGFSMSLPGIEHAWLRRHSPCHGHLDQK